MSNSKKIGIVGWKTGDNSFGVTRPYAEFIQEYLGGTMYILSPQSGIVEGLDLLILPGGADISPKLAGGIPSFYTGNNDVMKEFFFTNNLQQYIDAEVPILGICLGMQQLACHFGAKMIQHFPFDVSDPRDDAFEELNVRSDYSGFKRFMVLPKSGKGEPKPEFRSYKVNSLHHQCVSENNFPASLEIIATSKDAGNIEIFRHRELPILGVQFHPEELVYNYPSNVITKRLINEFLFNGAK